MTLEKFDEGHFNQFINQEYKVSRIFDETMLSILNIFIILKKV